MRQGPLFFDPDCRRPVRRWVETGLWRFVTFAVAVEILRDCTAAPPGFLATLAKQDRHGREAIKLIRAMRSRQIAIFAEFLRLVEDHRIRDAACRPSGSSRLLHDLRQRAEFRRLQAMHQVEYDPLPEELAPYGALLSQVCVEVPEEPF
jgi:hypothetical protein